MELQQVNENSVLIKFGNDIDVGLPSQIQSACSAIKQRFVRNVRDLTPSYTTLLVEFVEVPDLTELRTVLVDVAQATPISPHSPPVVIPGYYHQAAYTDLDKTAASLKLTPAELIHLHTSTHYTVCAIGFMPGFGFMAELPPSLVLPRLSTPKRVNAGSIAIADRQTAVYPSESPGGWHVLGLCPLPLFDKQSPQDSLLKVGMQVRFESISREQYFERLEAEKC
ncbi:5-oxoprolinase subunit B family protein [Thaumasiovibrio subtropicus]|uniref:5-oxoprolinase subunit B family protein n=1 Tax=Thaumasiovibrio subtropicus TaxID=1891207 RepID=UPI000B34C908|nr:allophanate hydrolase subunit 1 [Thaumasiovibrio subtropicus]